MLTLLVQAQVLLVRSVELDGMDISASTERRMDSRQDPCALIKLNVVDQLATIEDAELVGDIKRVGTTTWVYVPYGTDKVTLLFENHDPLTINFADYALAPLQRLTTYVVTLVEKAGTLDPDNPTDAVAQYELGQDYAHGRNGKPVIEDTAVKWFQKAAEQGHEKAQAIMGTRNYKKFEYYKDQKYFDEAVAWWEKAASQGLVDAQWDLAQAYEANVTEENQKEYVQKTMCWAEKAAHQGHTRAMELLGGYYSPDLLNSNEATVDMERALYWLEKAADKGSKAATYHLGTLYEYGLGVKKDLKKAREWYQRSANLRNQGAKDKLKEPVFKNKKK